MENSNVYENNNTKAFNTLGWVSFGISLIGTLVGIYILDVTLPTKGFFFMSYVFSISSCFTIAKIVRDKQEASKLIHKVELAKTEKLINEYS